MRPSPTLLAGPARSARLLAAVALLPLTTAVLALGASPAHAQVVSGSGCTDTDGVTVVVDFTDLDGDIEVGCAEGDPASGREALESAGFTPEDSQPGMICTIDGQPDPCPEEFDGSYWSYWHAEDDAWVSYQVGADDADPIPGDVEGWRYFDGSAGPQLEPAEVAAAAADPGEGSAEEAGESDSGADDDDADKTSTAVPEEVDDSDPSGYIAAGVVAVVLIAGIVLVVRRRRESARSEDTSEK